MKVKQVPGDFVVEERASIVAADRGRFAVYRLEKTGIGTLEALRAVRRAWRVPARAVGFGGLKDRHAETVQWVTIPAGPKRNLAEKAFRLTYQGKSEVPMSRMALTGNRFRLRLREDLVHPADPTRLARPFRLPPHPQIATAGGISSRRSGCELERRRRRSGCELERRRRTSWSQLERRNARAARAQAGRQRGGRR